MPIRLLALLTAIAGGASPVAAQQPGQVQSGAAREVPTARATRTTAAPTIDGRLDDPAWVQAPVISDFIQNEPNDGRPVTERTEVRILFDDQAIYLGAWLFDSDPSAIVAGESRRDVDLTQLDAFLMVVDTYKDRQNAFVFGTSPMGVEYDGQVTREGEGGSGQNVNITATRQQRGAGAGLNINWDG
ncbi:MAG: carbohydrate binding family 9 domain-containing protein, partial [Gemmatimonadota bacterium]